MAGEIEVTAVGNLGGDPEVAIIGDEEVTKFEIGVGVQRKPKDVVAGVRWEDLRTDWVRVTVWGNQGRTLLSELKKGMRVEVRGRLKPGAYIAKDGTARPSIDVSAARVLIVPRAPRTSTTGVTADDKPF